MAEGAPRMHPKGNLLSETIMKRGNVDKAIAEAKHVVTQRYSTPRQEHAFLEPESALAVPRRMRIAHGLYGGPRRLRRPSAASWRCLGLADEKVRVISKLVGGGFGGKEDLSVQHHAALLAWHSGGQ
jgi:CO/xanthine dehydrogenase Mo-binding subunit